MLGSDIGIAYLEFPGGPKLINSLFYYNIGKIFLGKTK